MPVKEGYTVTELMEKSKKNRGAVESFISRHKIKPLSYEAIYPPETLELLLESRRGRPKKSKPSSDTEPAVPPKKGRKP
jgi:hypothetical protein